MFLGRLYLQVFQLRYRLILSSRGGIRGLGESSTEMTQLYLRYVPIEQPHWLMVSLQVNNGGLFACD